MQPVPRSRRKPAAPQWLNPHWGTQEPRPLINGVCVLQTALSAPPRSPERQQEPSPEPAASGAEQPEPEPESVPVPMEQEPAADQPDRGSPPAGDTE